MNIVVVGHVDHGKSTLIGKLLVETGSLPLGKLEQVKAQCERTARVFEYAFLLDSLKAEQNQGITIEVARIFFKTDKRDYIMIDAPGHVVLLKNMITGAARAEAAVLVIDAKEGIQENTRRHAYLLSMLGIHQIAIVINKMDLVDYSEEVYKKIIAEFELFLKQINIYPSFYIPASGIQGDTIVHHSQRMQWYAGPTVIQALDLFKTQFENGQTMDNGVFRMPVQDIYKFTEKGDERRIVAGTIESGTVKVGDEVIFYPSENKSRITSFASFNCVPPTQMRAGFAIGFMLADPIYIRPGELACLMEEIKPKILKRFKARIFWLGKLPMKAKKLYTLKLGNAKSTMKLEKIERLFDASTLSPISECDQIPRNAVAECIFQLSRPIAADLPNHSLNTSRFVIVDQFAISGGGTVMDVLPETGQSETQVLSHLGWKRSQITEEGRRGKFRQKSALILVSSPPGGESLKFAHDLETRLFSKGFFVYSVHHEGLSNGSSRSRDIEALLQFSQILLEAGIMLIVSLDDLTQEELDVIRLAHPSDEILTVGIGRQNGPICDLQVNAIDQKAIKATLKTLLEKGILLKKA